MTPSRQEIDAPPVHPRWTIMTAHERTARLWLAAFVVLHLLPLLAGSTDFTIFTVLRRPHAFNWSYFDFSYSNGWGYVYQSAYSPWQIAAYVLAYASGLVLYPKLTRPRWLASVAAGLSLMGAMSFVIEASHFIFDHNLSLIGSTPILLLPIAMWTLWNHLRQPHDRLQ